MSFRDRLRLFWRRFGAGPLARRRAQWLLWCGRPDDAGRVLARAAAAAPSSFSAQHAFGRVLLALGRDAEAREAFRRCYRLSSARFLRLDLPAGFREVTAMECELAPVGVAVPGRAPATGDAVGACFAAPPDDPPPPRSDFASGAEARRFQGLEPLAITAAKDVDWDDLLDRLARPPRSGGARGA
ncbi:MAG TPA: hypothetical protein VEI02_08985 [Planctomycetota bacterium]|nr:hypothetical protein [Planctomycetota bacterium]